MGLEGSASPESMFAIIEAAAVGSGAILVEIICKSITEPVLIQEIVI